MHASGEQYFLNSSNGIKANRAILGEKNNELQHELEKSRSIVGY